MSTLSWIIGKEWRTQRKKSLMVDDYIRDKELDKVKETKDVEKFDYATVLIDTDDNLPDDITFKNVGILITCNMKDDNKFYPQILLQEALLLA